MFQTVPGAPLIVAANRDELYERPSVAMTVLRQGGPRILGGRDELAGGTWLAVNEHAVVAALVNQPSAEGHQRRAAHGHRAVADQRPRQRGLRAGSASSSGAFQPNGWATESI